MTSLMGDDEGLPVPSLGAWAGRGWWVLGLLLLGMLGVRLTAAESHADEPDLARARVLLLGDSISIGYTPFVREMLREEADVFRPMLDAEKPENCAGTLRGVAEVERWLKMEGGKWDVIHFNFGLHDIKRVDRQTGEASNRADDPRQSEPAAYARQLETIVESLEKSGARLIFATTTPVPAGGVTPHRDVGDPERYNAIAVGIMERHGIAVNDLGGFAQSRLKEIQQPVNVHFTPGGSEILAREVVRHIRMALP